MTTPADTLRRTGDNMSDTEVYAAVYAAVEAELQRARTKYPQWPLDIVHAAAIAAEESGEVTKAVNNFYWRQGADTVDDIRAEAVQAIAMLWRFLVETPAMQEGQR